MFNNKPYFEVTREERFFCAVLFHVILSSGAFRERLFGWIGAKTGVRLDAANYEIFLEAAILRDYWNDLGCPRAYDGETHKRRRAVIEIILREAQLPLSVIDDFGFFWSEPSKKKLVSPGRWDEKAIIATGWDEAVTNMMIDCKKAFNSKPDILIISGRFAVMIEAKVESNFGAGQRRIQKAICYWMKHYIPAFRDLAISDIELTKRDAPKSEFEIFGTPMTGVSWQEVVEMLDGIEIDEFSRRCLKQLERYY